MSEETIKKNLHMSMRSTRIFLWGILSLLFLIYALSGIYAVSQNELGVLQRFGKMIDSHVMPGIHYAFPWPIDRIDKVVVKKVHRIILDDFFENSHIARIFRDLTDLDSYCITGDNNVVNLTCVLQYTIDQPSDYLFNMSHNEAALKNIASATIIKTVADMSVDEILTYGKSDIEHRIKRDLQTKLDNLKTGLNITFVELREVRPPEKVQSYFDDVINAQIDMRKYVTTSESYRNEQILNAQAQANRMIQNALAYRQRVIAEATGETQRFLEQLIQAKKDPKITREQLYMRFVKEIWPKVKKKYIVEPGSGDQLRIRNP